MAHPIEYVRDIPHLTPVTCPLCRTASAHLNRRGPDGFKRDGKSEIWVFRCEGCGCEYAQSVES